MSYQPSQTSAREEGAHAPFVRAARAHVLLIAAITIAAVVTAVVWQTARAPKYSATAQVLVTPVENGVAYGGLPAVVVASPADPQRTLQTATSVLESPVAALTTSQQLGRGWTPIRVTEAVKVQPRGESDILAITGTAPRAAEAARLANYYAHDALAQHANLLGREARTQVAQLQEQARALPAGERADTQLTTKLAALSTVANGHDPNFSLLQAAAFPTSSSGTSKKLIIVLALLAGLAIGVGAATVIEYLNRRVRDEEELLSLYPLPVLSRVPLVRHGTAEVTSLDLIPPRVREAFRTLQIQFPPEAHRGRAHRGRSSAGGRAIMFTSPSPRDGKTASAISYSLVLAASNFRVILFDFDLRRSDVGKRLNVGADLPDLSRMDTRLDQLLVEPVSAPGLRVFSANSHGDAARALDIVGRRLSELLRTARELADYVIVDTPPLGQVSDALRAAVTVDDIVLVTRPGNTDRTELQHTRELLDRLGHTPTGLLVIGDTGAGDAYASYGADVVAKPNGRSPASAPAPPLKAGAGDEAPTANPPKPFPYP
jgi:tyrosine-protein kinase